VLEAATWRTKNRKHFAVLENVYEKVDRPFRTDDWDPADDMDYAAGLVHCVGSYLLANSISTGAVKENEKSSNRRVAKAWKRVSPESGARASAFLTLGVATLLSPKLEGEEFDQDAIRGARDLVARTFAVSDDDLRLIQQIETRVVEILDSQLTQEAVERGGLADRFAMQNGQAALSYHAMKIAGVDTDELPAFEPIRGVPPDRWDEIASFDWLMTFSIRFAIFWKIAKEAYLDMAYSRAGIGDSLGYRLVSSALDRLGGTWEWEVIPGVAVVKTADQLSNFREEYNLVLDAIALGYWIRKAERELADGIANTFDPDYVAQIREKFQGDEPDTILTIGMNEVSKSLPEPFAHGAEVWSEVLGLAIPVLEKRGRHILADTPEFDEDVDISPELREFVLGLGYGLAATAEALEIEGTRPRQA